LALRQTVWQRWKRLAHRAAVVQSHVLLFLLYVLVVVPVAAVGRMFGAARAVLDSNGWRALDDGGEDLTSARRQF
jgi:hypothetical protein